MFLRAEDEITAFREEEKLSCCLSNADLNALVWRERCGKTAIVDALRLVLGTRI